MKKYNNNTDTILATFLHHTKFLILKKHSFKHKYEIILVKKITTLQAGKEIYSHQFLIIMIFFKNGISPNKAKPKPPIQQKTQYNKIFGLF